MRTDTRHCISLIRTLLGKYSEHRIFKRSISFQLKGNSFELNFLILFLSLSVVGVCMFFSALVTHVCLCMLNQLILSLVFRIHSHGDSISLSLFIYLRVCLCTELSVSVVCRDFVCDFGTLFLPTQRTHTPTSKATTKKMRIENTRKHQPMPTLLRSVSIEDCYVRVVLFCVALAQIQCS